MIRWMTIVVPALLLPACSQPPEGIEKLRAEARAAALLSDSPDEHQARLAAIRERAAAAGYDPDLIPLPSGR